MTSKSLLIGALAACIAVPALSAVVEMKDASGATWGGFVAGFIGTNSQPQRVDSIHGLPMTTAGGNGTDYSPNQESVSFGSGPSYTPSIAGQTLIATIPANPGRHNCQIMNRSAGAQLVVFDDGAGASPTVFSLASGGTAGGQGGSMACDEHKGRVSVFSGSSTDKVAVRDN
jgi:hypothetical protein